MDIVYCETIVLYRDDRMLDRIHSTVDSEPLECIRGQREKTESGSGLVSGVSLVIKHKHHDNYHNTLMMRGRITKS